MEGKREEEKGRGAEQGVAGSAGEGGREREQKKGLDKN